MSVQRGDRGGVGGGALGGRETGGGESGGTKGDDGRRRRGELMKCGAGDYCNDRRGGGGG